MITRILYEEISDTGDIVRFEKTISSEEKKFETLGILLGQVLLSCVDNIDWSLSLSFQDMLEYINLNCFEHSNTPEIQHILGVYIKWVSYMNVAIEMDNKHSNIDAYKLMEQFYSYINRFKFKLETPKSRQSKEF